MKIMTNMRLHQSDCRGIAIQNSLSWLDFVLERLKL